MSADPFIGEIMMWGGSYAPRNWAFCSGQLLSISDYSPLFALIGTYYGGNGRTNFALPDLRGRVPLMWEQGTGLTYRPLGVPGGAESRSINVLDLPELEGDPTSTSLVTGNQDGLVLATLPPYLAISFVICLHGNWPSRSW